MTLPVGVLPIVTSKSGLVEAFTIVEKLVSDTGYKERIR
jgi:hypothetical protein